MYQRSRMNRFETRRRVGRAAFVSAILSLNVLILGLFVCAIFFADKGLRQNTSRLDAADDALAKHVAEAGSISEEELDLIRTRAERVKMSEVADAVAAVSLPEIWFTRLKFTGRAGSGSGGTPGLRMEGKLRAGREDESLAMVMEFLNALGREPVFLEHFAQAKLISSEWTGKDNDEGLSFAVLFPLAE
jgi:hypothetical protein